MIGNNQFLAKPCSAEATLAGIRVVQHLLEKAPPPPPPHPRELELFIPLDAG